eukprot:GHVL01031309.1.p1 GENE.GHVL01031309.1~~GHVL01031309.1.p1  ORF type:complete len:280 (+),score=29.02 GHVL01031309.1:67-906(+)
MISNLDDIGYKIAYFFNPYLITPPFTSKWLLCNFSSALIIAIIYILFVIILSNIMKILYGSKESGDLPQNKKLSAKFEKEPILLAASVYNLIQVVLCSYMVVAAVKEFIKEDYRPICNKFALEGSGMTHIVWMFYMSKILDFVDTLLIIVRRKWRQLSFLHIYHHLTIFLVYWLIMIAGYDGDVYLTILLNGSIHVLMYFYYFLRSIDIYVPIALKQLLTNLQMIQFLTMNLQGAMLIYYKCAYPHRLSWLYLMYIITLFLLFKNFANETYHKKKISTA